MPSTTWEKAVYSEKVEIYQTERDCHGAIFFIYLFIFSLFFPYMMRIF